METKVYLCDNCKKVVKEFNCDICGVDLCNNCRQRSRFNFDDTTLIEFYMCGNCNGKLATLFRDKSSKEIFIKNFPPLFKLEFIKLLKRNLILKTLDNEKTN